MDVADRRLRQVARQHMAMVRAVHAIERIIDNLNEEIEEMQLQQSLPERGTFVDGDISDYGLEVARLEGLLAKYDCGLTVEAQGELASKNRELLTIVAKRSAEVARLEELILGADEEDGSGSVPYTIALEVEAKRIRTQREEW